MRLPLLLDFCLICAFVMMISEDLYVNLHTHQTGQGENVISVLNRMAGSVIHNESSFYSLGIHPWQLQSVDPDKIIDAMHSDLKKCNPIAIGEAGFDRAIDVPLHKQQKVLVWQEELALSMNLPMIYHAVKANDLLLARAKALPGLIRIFHGFAGRPTAAQQLLDAGFCLSYGHALFDKRSQAAKSLIITPVNQLFLETDDRPISIEEVYEQAALLRGETVVRLRNAIFANFVRIFKPKE